MHIQGQGAVEAGPVSTPHFSKRMERPRPTKIRHRDEKLMISTEELRRQLDSELDDIQQLRESLHSELTDADLSSSNGLVT